MSKKKRKELAEKLGKNDDELSEMSAIFAKTINAFRHLVNTIEYKYSKDELSELDLRKLESFEGLVELFIEIRNSIEDIWLNSAPGGTTEEYELTVSELDADILSLREKLEIFKNPAQFMKNCKKYELLIGLLTHCVCSVNNYVKMFSKKPSNEVALIKKMIEYHSVFMALYCDLRTFLNESDRSEIFLPYLIDIELNPYILKAEERERLKNFMKRCKLRSRDCF